MHSEQGFRHAPYSIKDALDHYITDVEREQFPSSRKNARPAPEGRESFRADITPIYASDIIV